MQLTIDCGKFHPDAGTNKGFLEEDPFVVLRFDPTPIPIPSPPGG